MTGATGLIGSLLAEQLHKRDHKIIGLVRSIKKIEKNFFHQCYEWKSAQTPLPSPAFENISCIINLAGEPIMEQRWTPKQKQKLQDSRIQLTKKIVQKAHQYPNIHTLISASAVGYYGHRQDEILDENSLSGRGFIPQLCSRWEQSALEFKGRSVVLRFGHVLSHSGGFLGRITPLFKWCLGGTLSDGKQWMSWIHIHDLHRMIIEAVENNHWENIMNATSLHPVTNLEFTRTLAQVLKRPAPWILPQWALNLRFGERGEIITKSQRVIPVEAQKKGFIFRYSKLNQALSQIYKKDF